MTNKLKEKIGFGAFALMATFCIIAVFSIFFFLTVKSVPAIRKIGVFDFLFGSKWSPVRNDSYEGTLTGQYGIFTMIVSTLVSTVGALIIGGSLGFFTSVFIVFYCPKKLKRPIKTVINLLAGIPSVVYGFFGISLILPILSLVAPNNGSGLLATSLLLGIMILPTVVALSRVSLESVPKSYYDGARALGADHTSTVFKIITPSARSGIIASLALGIGRALGETMAVIMVAGNFPAYPDGLFGSFRVMTANIALEMGYAGQVQQGALIATGAVLLFFIIIVNLIFNSIVERKQKTENKNTFAMYSIKHKLKTEKVFELLSKISGGVSVAILFLIIGFVLIRGLPTLVSSPYLVFGKFQLGGDRISVFPAIVCTVMTVIISVSIAIPVGVMTAVFLNEYVKKAGIFVRMVRSAIGILGGVPSIVYGLFGMITFVRILGGKASILAGSFTISVMLLPTIVRSVSESLKTVPSTLKEASLALGAGRLRTITKVILPSALQGIVSAIILSIGRVISESAPLLYTMGSVIKATPKSVLDGGATLSVALYQLSGEGWYIKEAYATAVILMLIVLGLNLLLGLLEKRIMRKLQGDIGEKKGRKEG